MKRWNKKEFLLLEDLLGKGYTYLSIANVLGRSYKAVRVQAQKKGLNYNPSKYKQYHCMACDKEFKDLVSRERKFCSSSCAATITNSIRPSKVGSKFCKRCEQLMVGKPSSQLFCSFNCFKLYRKEEREEDVLKGEASPMRAKLYLLDKNNTCSECGIPPN